MDKLLKAIIAAALWPALVAAQTIAPAWSDLTDDQLAALQAKGDVERGRAEFETCVGCHRQDASGRKSGAYPRLAGQHATVLIKQIVDIRTGRRINPKMEPYIADHDMTPFQIADVATYLQSLPIPPDNGKGPGAQLATGKELYERDCATCHGKNGEGDAAKFYPMVAAQHYRYLLRQMQSIRDGERRNSDPDMVKVVQPLALEDLKAIADYLSHLGPPAK